MKTLTLIFGMLFGCMVYGQTQGVQNDQNKDLITATAKSGTFQFIFNSENSQAISIDRELLEKIESKRSETNETYLLINEMVIVRILPRSVINQNNFAPLVDESIINKKLFQEMKNRTTL